MERGDTELVELLSELVRTPSVNPRLDDGPGSGESGIADVIVKWAAARGMEAWTEEVSPGRPNAVVQVGSGGPVLVMCAHIDTVSVANMTRDPFDGMVEGDRLYGRGAYDMKGGVAAVLSSLHELSKMELKGTVLAALVADEEYASDGAYDFVKRHRADACIVTEPSDLKLVLAHKGFVWFELKVAGRGAHGSRWDLGDSAIARMARVVAALDAYDRETLRQRTYPLLGPASMHCGVIAGGDGISTYAPWCRAEIERRTLPGETPEQVEAEIRAIIASTGEPVEIVRLLDRPPLVCDADAPIARAVRTAGGAVTGSEPEICGVAYWMDAAVFAEAGIPTVNIGASGAGAHAAEEWVDLRSVVTNARILTRAALDFFAQA